MPSKDRCANVQVDFIESERQQPAQRLAHVTPALGCTCQAVAEFGAARAFLEMEEDTTAEQLAVFSTLDGQVQVFAVDERLAVPQDRLAGLRRGRPRRCVPVTHDFRVGHHGEQRRGVFLSESA